MASRRWISRRELLVLTGAAIGGIFSGTARAIAEWVLSHLHL
jgi:hypothetical protein